MKQRIKFVLYFVLIISALCMGTAFADSFADAYTDEPPVEVLLHIQEKYPDDLMEDYIAINGTPKGDYGFALMSQGGSRVLVGYRDTGSGMKYWFRSADAVPQGDGYVYFKRHANGGSISSGNTSATYSNALGFDVIRIDKEHEEYWSQMVSYHWSNGAFQLCAYMDVDHGMEQAYVTDSGVSYYNERNGRFWTLKKGSPQKIASFLSISSILTLLK